MVVYRSREFMVQNRFAAASVGLGLVVLVVALVTSGAWGRMPGLGFALIVVFVLSFATPLTITVQDSGTNTADSDAVIHVSLAGVLRRSIPLADVKRLERRDYRPLREFGGWGWRHAWKRPAVAYTMRGTSAVVLQLRNKSEIYLGVADEQALIDALKTRIYR